MRSIKHWPLLFVPLMLGYPSASALVTSMTEYAAALPRNQEFQLAQQVAQDTNSTQSAWDLYKAGEYAAALEKFQASAQTDPDNPKHYWGMTLVHNKLQQYDQAKVALDRAVELDPSLSFTQKDSYDKLRSTIENKLVVENSSGGNESATAASDLSESAELILALKDQAVFASSTMQDKINADRISQAAQNLDPYTVKFAVLDSVSGDRKVYAKRVFDYLNLKNGAVIVATQNGVDLFSDRFDESIATELAKDSRVEFTPTEYTQGLTSLAQAAADQVQSQNNQRNILIGGAIATLGAGAGAVALSRHRRKQKQWAELNDLRSQVATTLSDMQSYVQVLPENAHTQKAEQLYEQASQQFLQASDILEQEQTSPMDMQRADADLRGAQQLLQNVRREIDLATGAQPETPSRPPETASACFFCSRPQSIEQLQIHLLLVNRLQKQVLCCAACAAQLNAGRTPKIRTVKKKGQTIPWYRDRDYVPYRDYYQYDREWHSTTVYDVDIEYDNEDVVIYADHPKYRNYQVDRITDESTSTLDPADQTAFAFSDSQDEPPEASTDTDFFWADDSPEVADSSGEAGFFDSDLS